MPGPRCRRSPSSLPAMPRRSAAASHRRPPTGSRLSCASSPGTTSRPGRIERREKMARILIAEDEEALRGFVVRALTQDGHEVFAAPDGAEALDVLTRNGGRFDLLLADIKMPVMDGIALALAVARDDPDLVILLMTGFADQRERASGPRD